LDVRYAVRKGSSNFSRNLILPNLCTNGSPILGILSRIINKRKKSAIIKMILTPYSKAKDPNMAIRRRDVKSVIRSVKTIEAVLLTSISRVSLRKYDLIKSPTFPGEKLNESAE